MSKPFRDEKLAMILLCQLHGYMLTVCRTSFPDINGHVENSSLDTTH